MQLSMLWLGELSIVFAVSARHLRMSSRQTPVVSDAFATINASSRQTGVFTDTIEGINEAIFRAKERKDNLEFDCDWASVKYNDLVSAAHGRQFATDSTMGELRTKQMTTQGQQSEATAAIDKVKLKRAQHIQYCGRFKESGSVASEGNKENGDLADALSDLVKCPGGVFVQKSMWLNCSDNPGGNLSIAFEDPTLQAKSAQLSKESYNMLQVALLDVFNSRSSSLAHQTPPPPPPAPPPDATDKDSAQKCVIPKRAVDCAALSDSMSRLKGLLGDQGQRNAAEMRKMSKKCAQKTQSIDRNLARLNNILKTASQTLVDLGKEIAAAERQQHIASRSHDDAKDEQDARKQRCKNEVYDLGREICELQKRRSDLLRIRGQSALVGDCEVSPWAPQAACSAKCGGGKQKFTREVVSQAMGGARCPSLEFEKKCNTGPCPVDCKVGAWSPWTECSVTCGDGVRSKKRKVITESENNGTPCPPTLESQFCGGTPCETDCVLGEWGPWKSCTRACGGGKQARTRGINKTATGRFHCPKEGSNDRTEFQACNKQACPAAKDAKCSSKADLVMLLDGSGSMTEAAFEKQKAFALDLASRFTLDKSKGHLIGAVIYAEGASTVFPLTDDAALMRTSIGGLRRGRGGASLSGGLHEAKQLLGKGRKDKDTSNIVLVLADGPADSEVLSEEAAHELQSYGVRVVVTAVGDADAQPLQALASQPKKQNFFTAKSFEELQRDVQSRMIEICSDIAV